MFVCFSLITVFCSDAESHLWSCEEYLRSKVEETGSWGFIMKFGDKQKHLGGKKGLTWNVKQKVPLLF